MGFETRAAGGRTSVLCLALAVALGSALPHAGSWYDGSRLATIESLIDRGTWSIDDSIFVRPAAAVAEGKLPYAAHERALLERGTLDKLLIDGRYYSDKSPVPALYMAGVYQVLQWTTGLVARESPAWFCYLLTLFSSGLAYVVAVYCIDRLAGQLPSPWRSLTTASFALATIALPYARQVNNHILLLALCCALLFFLRADSRRKIFAAGTLIGAGYCTDLGIGPVLVLATTGLVAFRTRRVGAVALLLAAAFPWFALHHYFNWQIGGTFTPANAHLEYLTWPGSPFTAANATGRWAHESLVDFVAYSFDLLFGKRGFIGHNLALFLALPGAVLLIRRLRPLEERREIIWAIAFFLGSWLVYAITSTNYAGGCCSVRWFVPLLAPGYYVLVLLLREKPELRPDFALLTGFGFLLALICWWKGPWMLRMVPGYWFILGGALVAWAGWRLRSRKS